MGGGSRQLAVASRHRTTDGYPKCLTKKFIFVQPLRIAAAHYMKYAFLFRPLRRATLFYNEQILFLIFKEGGYMEFPSLRYGNDLIKIFFKL